jgi:ATP phosphoribosyltransferase
LVARAHFELARFCRLRDRSENAMLRFAIPSKGSGYDGSVSLLESCGLRVSRANPRQYTARLRGLPDTEVLLHRPADIVEKVLDGSIDIGITSVDLVSESGEDAADDLIMLHEDLGFWRVELVFAVPQAWIDVVSLQDLADLAFELQAQGRPLRIATKYHNVVRRFCYEHGINVFRLVASHGATEAAPALGYADIIADITETGTALRDNQLKIVGGPILRSQACLIGSRRSLREGGEKLARVKDLLELLEARERARQYYSIAANVAGNSLEEVGRKVIARPELAGVQGPTIAPVWDKAQGESSWFAVTVVVPLKDLLPAVSHLRNLGASSMTVLPVQYAFHAESDLFQSLLSKLS